MNHSDNTLFFFHIMKTGGTTLTSLIDRHFDSQQLCPARHWYELERFSSDELAKYRVFRGHFNLAQLFMFQEFPYAITLIRNPVDRVISEYNHWRRAPEQFIKWHPEYEKVFHLAKELTILEFIRREEETGFFINNRQVYQLGLFRSMPRPKVEIQSMEVLAKAKENLEKFQIVGTIESIRRVVEILCYYFRWPSPVQIPNVRATESEVVPEISLGIQEEIAARNQLDLALYEYARDRINAQYDAMLEILGIDRSLGPEGLPVVVQDTLHQRYENAFRIAHPQLLNRLLLTFDQAIYGDGWYGRQYDPDLKLTWRWSGPGTTSILDLPLTESQSLRVSFDIVKVAAPELIRTMEIRVNDITLKYWLKENGDIRTCTFDIPVRVLRRSPGRARIAIAVKKTVKIPDRYPYSFIYAGIAVSVFRVFPLPSLKDRLLSCFSRNK